MGKIRVQGALEQFDDRCVSVDLADLAAFAREVKVAYVFEVCVEYAKLMLSKRGVRLQMTPKNWQRVNASPAEDRLLDVARALRQLTKKHAAIETILRDIS